MAPDAVMLAAGLTGTVSMNGDYRFPQLRPRDEMAGHRDYPGGRDGVDASRSPIFYNEPVMSGGLSYGLVAEHIHSSASRGLS
jgi:hypothetical protein